MPPPAARVPASPITTSYENPATRAPASPTQSSHGPHSAARPASPTQSSYGQHSAARPAPSSTHYGQTAAGRVAPPSTNYGKIIEYIENRVYLASYTKAPNELTPFPYPEPPPKSPHKRSSKSQNGPAPTPVQPDPNVLPPVYFTIDNELLYNRFYADFGPLHIGHLYRFAVLFHDVLGDPANANRCVVFWSKPDARCRANAACLLACYMIVIQNWPPHLALAPIAQADPPLMPFRDAGYSQADFVINVQDVVYGVWKAKEQGLCGFRDFSLEEYERYERVDQGDFNWITPDFLALASPQHEPIATISPTSPLYASLPKNHTELKKSDIPSPFKNVLSHFSRRNVGLVVRLNSELYSPSYFTALGINHLDMIFDDGTCPPLPMVKKFINIAHEMITVQKKAIGVHCKAGLGRTGCLIGAYLIYRHGFTANEIIAYMRFMRPGMVVGPQQHWLHLNQDQFRGWWWEDTIKEKLAVLLPSTPTKVLRRRPDSVTNVQTITPPHGSHAKRSALGEINHNEASPASNRLDDNLPAPTPGQPRKTNRIDSRHHPYSRTASATFGVENEIDKSANEVVEMISHRKSQNANNPDGEEFELKIRRKTSHSPVNSEKRRAISYTTTTTTSTRFSSGGDGDPLACDIENWVQEQPQGAEKISRPRTPWSSKTGSGSGTIGFAKVRGSPTRRSGESKEVKNGVRKISGRVGSVGNLGAVARSRS